MPLEHILRAMQWQADNAIAQIARAAEAESAQLIADAEAQAQTIRARHRARVEPRLAHETANIHNQARLNVLRALADAREQLLNDAFLQAEMRLGQIRQSDQYTVIFRALAREAVDALGIDVSTAPESKISVRVDPGDTSLASQVFADFSAPFVIETRPMPMGGLELTTHDGRVIVTNTVAMRLERARKLVRGAVAAILVRDAESNLEWMTNTDMPMPA